MLFMPFEVTLNVHHQHFAISWNKLFILKMFSDYRNSDARRAASVPLTYTEALLYFLTLQGTFEIISAVTLS